MNIRDKDGKLAITPGEWQCDTEGLGTDKGTVSTPDGYPIMMPFFSDGRADDIANGCLSAEAGTIANRYDATPAEMVETIRELRRTLCLISFDRPFDTRIQDALKETTKYEDQP